MEDSMANKVGCIGCARGFHWECIDYDWDFSEEIYKCCCHTNSPEELNTKKHSELSDSAPTEIRPTGGGYKADDEIGVSAGRKRAAVMYEINKDEFCEWRLQANCGGGKNPIVGCLTGKQQHRHHGPDKKTSNNSENNVHLICTNCHNLWHAKNDPTYIREEYQNLPHSPRPATESELLERGKS